MAYTNINQFDRLITNQEVIIQCITNANFDKYLISPDIIKIAEITHLEKPLSREFYEELVTQHDSAGTLTADNQTLMDDYLHRTLAWFVKFEMMNDIQNNTTSSGIMNNLDDFGAVVDHKSFDMMKQDVYRKANLFLQDMLDYLGAHLSTYPTYKNNTHDTSVLGDDSTNKANGIIFY